MVFGPSQHSPPAAHSPLAMAVQTRSLHAQLLSEPSAPRSHPSAVSRIQLPPSKLSCAASPALHAHAGSLLQPVGCSWVMVEESRSGVGVGGHVPHRGGEQTLFCLQGQQRTVGTGSRPSTSSEEGGSPGVTPAWGPASSQDSVSSPRGQEHVGSHPLLPLRC